MRIFYDLYEIAHDKGKSIGIYNYAVGLLNALALNNPKVDFIVPCSAEYRSDIPGHANIHFKIISGKYPTQLQRLHWRYRQAMRIAKKNRADIYFSPKGFSPGFTRRKNRPYIVVTIHDMIPFYYRKENPQYFGFFHNLVITKMMLQSIRIANSIITVSKFSRESIMAHNRRNREINLIYNGVSVAKNQKNTGGSDPYIFAITSNFPHKNKQNLINGYLVYARSVAKPLPLKICGMSEKDNDIRLDTATDISFVKYADAADFARIFSNASAFLYVPQIEGFGFPPLEALLYNIPSVVSDIPVLREVLSDSAVFVDPDDTEKIGAGLKTLLEDPALYNSILDKRGPTLDKYTWEKCSRNTMDVFKKVAQRNAVT